MSKEGKDRGKSGRFWEHVTFVGSGVPIYPEYSGEGELPYKVEDGPNMAKVKVSYGRTVNLGNYNSVRVDVGVELPCMVDEVEKAYDAASEFVGPKFAKLVNGVIQKRKSINKGGAIVDDGTNKGYGY